MLKETHNFSSLIYISPLECPTTDVAEQQAALLHVIESQDSVSILIAVVIPGPCSSLLHPEAD
jgi:hypothetical protein